MNNSDDSKILIPHLYVDTNILAGVLEKRHRASVDLLDMARNRDWMCSTSIFSLMELCDISQDNKYVLNQLQLGVHIKKAYKSLDQKALAKSDLAEIRKAILDIFTEKYPSLQYFALKQEGWDKALQIKSATAMSAPDILHLATALELKCDLLVTLDNFFKKEAEPYITACLPEQAGKILQDLGFKI